MKLKHELYERDDDLAHCKVCGGAEGSLPTHCPGTRMTPLQERGVQDGTAEFMGGKWWMEQESVGDMIRELLENTTGTADAVLQSFIANGKQPHEVFPNLGGDTLPGFPDDGKPFCRIQWFEDGGDMSVGIQATRFWMLAEDQSDTLIGGMLAREAAKKESGAAS